MVEDELQRFVVSQCTGKVLNNALQAFRVNVTAENHEVWVEPFMAGASFRALVRREKKRPIILTFLQAMCDWAASHDCQVNLLTISSRPRQVDRVVRFESLESFKQSYAP
jgi:hypothetical protein